MEIGNVIKEYRKLHKMTQEELGAALLVTPQAVSRWETGVSYPDIAMIPEIVKVLGVSADALLDCDNAAQDAEKKQTPTLDYQELVASVQGMEEKMLNQSQIDSIFDYVPHPGQTPKMVLIIDDSDFMRMMVTDMVSHEHHRVLQAASGEEGLNMLRGETCGVPVEVCILDIKMPGMNGLQVLEVIKKEYPQIRVIMLSAVCNEAVVKEAMKLGADGFVAKPFQAGSLLERI